MKIAVLMKQVPDSESRIKLSDDGRSVDESGIKWVMNPYDEYAVEEALRLKDRIGGEIVIVTAGPARAVDSMRQALAMGADRGIRIDCDPMNLDSYLTAKILADVCRDESFDIIFAGKQAIDDDCGQVHIGCAALLGWPHVTPIEKFELKDDNVTVRVTRAAAAGVKEIVESQLPIVLGCEKGLNEPRYASLPGIMKAKSKQIREIKANTLIGSESKRIDARTMQLAPERSSGRMIAGTADVAVAELIKILRDEMKII